MAAYTEDMHLHQAAYQYQQQQQQQSYHPQQAMINVDGSVNTEQGYANGEAITAYSVDYSGANGYYPPPQAPRLTAAAARASSMAAMYYNPTLHPQHAFSSNVASVGGPWMPTYRSRRFDHGHNAPSPAYQHQQLEHHLMAQNQVANRSNRAYQPSYYGAGGYGSAQSQFFQSQPQPQPFAHHHPRHSYPDERQMYPHNSQWDGAQQQTSGWSWDDSSSGQAQQQQQQQQQQHHRQHQQQQQVSEMTPTGNNTNQSNSSYFPYPSKLQYIQQEQQNEVNSVKPGPYTHSHSLSQPPPFQSSEGDWGSRVQQGSTGWNGQDADWRSYGPAEYRSNWGNGPAWNHNDAAVDNSQWNRIGPVDDPSRVLDQPQWLPAPQGVPYSHTSMVDGMGTARASGYYPLSDASNFSSQENIGPLEIADASKASANVEPTVAAKMERQGSTTAADTRNSGPAPPSPETLDKSSVPISSVGAEIVWIACAALLDPGLLELCARSETTEEVRKTSRSRTSISAFSPIVNPTPLTLGGHWSRSPLSPSSLAEPRNHRTTCKMQVLQRLAVGTGDAAAASSEESSASSSEPGTPPSSFPAHLYDDIHRSGGGGRRDSIKSLGAIQGLRDLGLALEESAYESPRNSNNPRDFSFSSHSNHLPQFARKSSQDVMGEHISDVLNLISPSWKWSINDDKLASLSSSLRDGAKANKVWKAQKPNTYSSMKRSSSVNTSSNSSSSIEQSTFPNGSAGPGSEPSPAFRRFAHQVLAQTLASPTAFMLAMMYSLRVPYLAVQTDSQGVAHLDPEAAEIFAQPPSAAPFKLFTLGLMIANKHLDDNTFLNKTWNEVTGISLSEINRMERWYLEKSSYEITVPEEPWIAFLERLAVRTEGKIASMGDARRYRVPTKRQSSVSVSNMNYSNVSNAAAKVATGSSNEEALKRLLLSIEEALVVIGRIAPFELSNSNAFSATGSSKKEYSSSSLAVNMLKDYHQRPNVSLHQLHHHCHSAPALALHHNAVSNDDTDLDVFEDEDGPYRPQGNSIRSSLDKQSRKGSLESILNRSISENSATSVWHPHHQSKSMTGDIKMAEAAPLAPSVLLDLLNRGQHFAHATTH